MPAPEQPMEIDGARASPSPELTREWEDKRRAKLLDWSENMSAVNWSSISLGVGGGFSEEECKAEYERLQTILESDPPYRATIAASLRVTRTSADMDDDYEVADEQEQEDEPFSYTPPTPLDFTTSAAQRAEQPATLPLHRRDLPESLVSSFRTSIQLASVNAEIVHIAEKETMRAHSGENAVEDSDGEEQEEENEDGDPRRVLIRRWGGGYEDVVV